MDIRNSVPSGRNEVPASSQANCNREFGMINNNPIPIVACVRNGDQRVFFDTARDFVVVITAAIK